MTGFEPAPSASTRSLPLLLEEMDGAGISLGVMVGRISQVFGSVSNDALLAIMAEHPGRFSGIASLDLASRKAAEAEIHRCVEAGFPAARMTVGSGQTVSVRLVLGGRRIIKKKKIRPEL